MKPSSLFSLKARHVLTHPCRFSGMLHRASKREREEELRGTVFHNIMIDRIIECGEPTSMVEVEVECS